MKTEDIVRLSDLNLAEYVRESARWNAAGEIFEQDDLLLTRGAAESPITSVAMNLTDTQDDSGVAVFERIRSFYRERKSGFSIHIRSHADAALVSICKQQKVIQISNAPGMIVDKPFQSKAVPNGIEIRPVTDVAGVVDFAHVSIESYQDLGMPASVSEKMFSSPERLLRPYNYLVVTYDAGSPLSAAMIVFSHGIAGIYWVGTLKDARGKGLAEACVRAVTNEAFQRGARFAVLQASKFGEPLYRRMGFTEVTRYPYYMCFDSR
jgi:GNAT superfamily N-acetyltransferase